jgi:hypothetical protein
MFAYFQLALREVRDLASAPLPLPCGEREQTHTQEEHA